MRWPLRVDFRAWLIGLVITRSALVLLTCYEYVCSYRDALMIIIGKRSGWTRVRRCASALTSLQLPSTRPVTAAHGHVPADARPRCGAGPSAPTSSPATGVFPRPRFPGAHRDPHARDTPSRHTRPTAAQTGGTLGRDSRAGGDRLGARGSAQAGAYNH